MDQMTQPEVRHEEPIEPGIQMAVGRRTLYRLENYIRGGLYRAGLQELKLDLEALLEDVKEGLRK